MQLCRRGDRSIGEVSRDLDLTESAVCEWIRQADVDRGDGPEGALTTAEKEELRKLRREVRQLREEREIPKKSDGLLREGEQVRFEFIDAEKANHSIRTLCRALRVSPSGYYAWTSREPSARARQDEVPRTHIRAIHKASRGTYGSPRVHAELRRLASRRAASES